MAATGDDPAAMAERLYTFEGFRPYQVRLLAAVRALAERRQPLPQVSAVIGADTETGRAVLRHYLTRFDFHGLDLVPALRCGVRGGEGGGWLAPV